MVALCTVVVLFCFSFKLEISNNFKERNQSVAGDSWHGGLSCTRANGMRAAGASSVDIGMNDR